MRLLYICHTLIQYCWNWKCEREKKGRDGASDRLTRVRRDDRISGELFLRNAARGVRSVETGGRRPVNFSRVLRDRHRRLERPISRGMFATATGKETCLRTLPRGVASRDSVYRSGLFHSSFVVYTACHCGARTVNSTRARQEREN